jgi:hypothetical protein
MSGHRRVGQAVILQAIADRATHWFTFSCTRQPFEFWCALGGLDSAATQATGTAKDGNGGAAALTRLPACGFASVLTLKTQVGGESYDSSLVLPHSQK